MFTTIYQLSGFFISIVWFIVALIIQKATGVTIYSQDENPIVDEIPTTNQLVDDAGYRVRDHVITTKDGYLLVLHKVEAVNPPRKPKGVVYCHHGLLTDSEIWVVGKPNLVFKLADQGYQVWLGNNRGNRYLQKHIHLSPKDNKFWNFSLDEYAMYDIPASLEYINQFNHGDYRITYIGFSQGCSQLLAALSLRPDLNRLLNLFVGLLPAVIPKNLNHPVFRMIVNKSSRHHQFLYSIFGQRAILPLVAYWQTWSWYPTVVETSLKYLFGWDLSNISLSQRMRTYPHLFSNTLVKLVHHWFQIIQAQRFQMFDERVKIGRLLFSGSGHKVAPFPIGHHLNVPMVLAFGREDILVDIEHTTKLITELNPQMTDKLWEVMDVPGYEHMDTLWADDVGPLFDKVIGYVKMAAGGI